MKAAFIESHGGPEVLRFGEMPDPVAGPGQIVVDIAAASVNGADWKVRDGGYGESMIAPVSPLKTVRYSGPDKI